MTTLNITLARSADGSVDVDASVAAFKAAVLVHIAERETETATIAAAVSETFDSLNGARANMPYVVGETVRRLNPQPANYNALTAAVAQYIRDNAGDRDSGKLFAIGKGKGGGVLRHSDQPEPKPEASK